MSKYVIWAKQGSGGFRKSQLGKIGNKVIFEKGVKVFNPHTIEIGSNVYFGHGTVIKASSKTKVIIGNDVWIGGMCFIHGEGGLQIENGVGIANGVKVFTSEHPLTGDDKVPFVQREVIYNKTTLKNHSFVGAGSIILPGITIGKGSVIGAGSVVTKDVRSKVVIAGNPARLIREIK